MNIYLSKGLWPSNAFGASHCSSAWAREMIHCPAAVPTVESAGLEKGLSTHTTETEKPWIKNILKP